MKTKIFILSIVMFQFTLSAQVMIERAGSPDFHLANMNALGNGITARMFFPDSFNVLIIAK